MLLIEAAEYVHSIPGLIKYHMVVQMCDLKCMFSCSRTESLQLEAKELIHDDRQSLYSPNILRLYSGKNNQAAGNSLISLMSI